MKGIRTWKYLTLLAVVGFWGCSPEATKNLAESDDLYGSAPDAVAYATPQKARKLYDNQPSKRYQRNSNPDFVADDQATAYNDEYYSDLSARKVTTRGISADPGWSSDTYNNGFLNGYNSAMMSSRWNTWGWNNPFMGGMGLGLGMSFGSPWGWGGGYSPFFSPFNSFGSYAYSPFYSPYSYYGGFNDPFYGGGGFYNPYYSYGGFYNRPTYVINNYGSNIGASRPVNYGARNANSYSRDRYNGDFVNTPRSYNGNNGSGARRSGELNSSNNVANTPSNGNAYYNRPASRQNSANSGSSNNSNYYYNGNANAANGRSSANPYVSTPRASQGGDYYAAPRQNSRGSYTPPSDNSYRNSSPQQSQSYQAPAYRSNQNAGFERSNSFSSPRPSQSYSPPSQSFGGGSRGGSVGGGGFSGGGGGGGSRGPR